MQIKCIKKQTIDHDRDADEMHHDKDVDGDHHADKNDALSASFHSDKEYEIRITLESKYHHRYWQHQFQVGSLTDLNLPSRF